MELNNESKTLFIPLYGKALMSKDNLFLTDPKAEEIINEVNFDFDKLKQSKWLSMYMSVRAMIIDELVSNYISKNKDSIIIHLGCGLDSRCLRVKENYKTWYDIDFENVIDLRKQFYQESDSYKMIGKSVTDLSWMNLIPKTNNVLIVAEGLFMYLSETEIQEIINEVDERLQNVTLLFDTYSKKAVKLSKYKNPVNQMNATIKYGIDNEEDILKLNPNLEFVRDYLIRHKEDNLKGLTKFIFENLYCGSISKSLYKIYEFRLGRNR